MTQLRATVHGWLLALADRQPIIGGTAVAVGDHDPQNGWVNHNHFP